MFGPSAGLTPTIWHSSARASGRSSPRATSAGSRSTSGSSWWEFIGAEQRSAAYQKFLATGITRSLVAAKARKASTRTIGDIFVQLMLTILEPDRGIDRPRARRADESGVDRSVAAYLESRGVQYLENAQVEEILCENGRITGVVARQQGQRTVVHGDHYVAALPLERHCPAGERAAWRQPTRRSPTCARWRRTWSG